MSQPPMYDPEDLQAMIRQCDEALERIGAKRLTDAQRAEAVAAQTAIRARLVARLRAARQ